MWRLMAPRPWPGRSRTATRSSSRAAASPATTCCAPSLPSAAEQGFPEVAAVTWYGLLSTGGTPAPRLAILSDALKATLADQEVRASLEDAGIDVETSSPQEFARYLAEDMARLGPLFRRASVTMD